MVERVVFWDFDGTLAHRPGLWSACLVECLVEVGGPAVEVGQEDVRPFLRGRFPWHRPEEGHEHLNTADAWWASLRSVFADALCRAGVPAAHARRAAELVRRRYVEPERWVVFADAPTALAAVAGAGWRNVILSNHVPELDQLVAALGLGPHLDAVFSSAVTGWEKPHPRFFRYALRAMGRPTHTWMVGDNPVADVAGAEAVGMPALLVRVQDRRTGTTGGLAEAVETIIADGRR